MNSDAETDWLPLILGVFVVALGGGGLYWFRTRQKKTSGETPLDLQSDDPAGSTFVSNVTAFELDTHSNLNTLPDRRGKGENAKKGREPSADKLSMTQADQRMMQETPPKASGSNPKISATNPPKSNAPSQIVVPKKSRPPVAS